MEVLGQFSSGQILSLQTNWGLGRNLCGMIGGPGPQEGELTLICVDFFVGCPCGHRGEGGLWEELAAGRHRWGASQVSNLQRPCPQLCPLGNTYLAPVMWWTPFLGARDAKMKKTWSLSWESFQSGKGETVKVSYHNHHTRAF